MKKKYGRLAIQIVGGIVGVIAGHTLINMIFGPRQPRDYGQNNNQQRFAHENVQQAPPQSMEYQMLSMTTQSTNKAQSLQWADWIDLNLKKQV